MKHLPFAFLLSAFLFSSCHTVPLTGRKNLTLLPEHMMQSMALGQYSSFLKTNPPVNNTPDAALVQRVGKRIEKAVSDYCHEKHLKGSLVGYTWNFNLVNNPERNAWCMPGCRVVVYSGLLPVTMNEAGLAAILGHEISHALARHGSERMTQNLLAAGIAIGGAIATSNNPKVNDIFNQSFGVASTLGLLAFSRQQENEADKMGMMFMAMAGYDPHEAIGLWKRMAQYSGPKPPELLSSHPSDASRIAKLTKALHAAMHYYEPPQ